MAVFALLLNAPKTIIHAICLFGDQTFLDLQVKAMNTCSSTCWAQSMAFKGKILAHSVIAGRLKLIGKTLQPKASLISL
ncbi:hypothetical protein D3C73_991700 [compost metagenome]